MKRVLIYVLVYLLISSLISGCEEPFERPRKISGGTVVIYGRVSDRVGDSYIEIGITRDKTSKPVAESGATVLIWDSLGNNFQFSEFSPGVYKPVNSDFRGVVGSTYYAEVLLQNEQVYRSAAQILLEPTRIDSIKTEFVKRENISPAGVATIQNYINLMIASDLAGSEYLRWDLEETFILEQTTPPNPMARLIVCYINQRTNSQFVNLSRSNSINSTELTPVNLGDRIIDYSFSTKHAFSVYQRSITQESYEYWSKINQVASVSGSIFDSPPATVSGNFSNSMDATEQVLGFFETSGTALKRTYIYYLDLPFFFEKPCRWSFRKDYYPGFCQNCISHPNSSYEAEEWFLNDEEE